MAEAPIPRASAGSTPAAGAGGAVRKSSIWPKLGLIVGVVYLLNPTLGVFELLPDNLPVIGNLDEGAAAALVLYGLGQLKGREKPGRDLRDSP